MIKKFILIGVAIITVSLLGVTQPASAHFIIDDSQTGFKALFHVSLDHNPIAGEESIISFDFSETGIKASEYSYSLTVKSTKDEAIAVPFEVTGDVLLASYTFASRGFYDINLTATNKKDSTVSQLHYGQRVSRGDEVKESVTFGTLEIAAIAGVGVIAVSAIIFSIVNDRSSRKGIKK